MTVAEFAREFFVGPVKPDPWQLEMLERIANDRNAIIRACGLPRRYLEE